MAGNRAPEHIYTGMTSVLYHVVNNSFVALSWLALQLSASAPGSQLRVWLWLWLSLCAVPFGGRAKTLAQKSQNSQNCHPI